MAKNDETKSVKAKQRWKLLLEILSNKSLHVTDNAVSVRRFTSFGLLSTDLCNILCSDKSNDISFQEQQNTSQHKWYKYQCSTNNTCYEAKLRHLDGTLHIEQILGFNNTGNVCVWPAEEILTYHCLQNLQFFSGKTVCELGGGMTCLAGIFLALHCDVQEMLLTDGNEQSVENVKAIINENKIDFGSSIVHSKVLRWNETDKLTDLKGHYDTVICADCLFFDEYREDLVNILCFLLQPQGEAIIFAPRRGTTFQAFQDLASKKFTVTHAQNYDQHVWNLHLKNKTSEESLYDADIHYPEKLHLKKLL